MQRKVFSILLLFILLSGCTSDETKNSAPKDVDITKLSTKKSAEQDISNHTKDILKKHDEITSIVAISTKKKLVVGIEVHHGSRFHLKSLRKKWKNELEKAFPKMDIKLTTDRKIIWELTELEKKIKKKSISKKDLHNKLKKIIKLMDKKA